MKGVIDLTLRVADGTATESECRELERIIESDRGARRLHLQLMEIEASLRASCAEAIGAERSLAEERTIQGVMARVRERPLLRPPRFAARPIWAALGVAALVASLAVTIGPRLAGRRPGSSARAPFVFGRSRAPLDPGVASGRAGWSPVAMRIGRPGADEVSRLELEDGVTLQVRGAGVVRGIERDASGTRRIVVDDGTVVMQASGGDVPALLFVTARAEVRAHARRLLLSASPDQTRVDVQDGIAAVTRLEDRAEVDLVAGQTATVGEGALTAHALPVVLFIKGHLSGRHPGDLLDGALVRRLEGLGFAVESVDEVELGAGHIAGKALLMISPSVSEVLATKIDELSLGAVGIPIICSRPALYPELSMSAPETGRFTSNATRLRILEPKHPLAAGLTGPLQVTRAPGSLGWGKPGPGAVRVAAFPDSGKSDRAVIFAYERDAEMVGSVARAPARRVGFFMHPDLAPYVTDAGWALLDAAVRWATANVRP